MQFRRARTQDEQSRLGGVPSGLTRTNMLWLLFTQTLLSMGMRLKAKWLELLPRTLEVGGG